MKRRYTYILFTATLCSFIILLSCNKEEQIPSYIRINSFTFTTDYPTQGSNSHKITDAWVYVNDKSIGIFELPVTLPVLAEGNSEIKIEAGIKNNGIAATRIAYPFYTLHSEFQTLTPESIITINPAVTYHSYVDVEWREDFEGAAFSIIDTINTDTVMKTTTLDVFEGNKCGIVTLDASKTTYYGVSANAFTLPKNAAPVYLEINYKSNNLFGIGIISSNSPVGQPIMFVNPSDTWNKLYVELTPLISNPDNLNPFRIYISMAKDASISNPELLIDNLKIVY